MAACIGPALSPPNALLPGRLPSFSISSCGWNPCSCILPPTGPCAATQTPSTPASVLASPVVFWRMSDWCHCRLLSLGPPCLRQRLRLFRGPVLAGSPELGRVRASCAAPAFREVSDGGSPSL